MRMYCMMHKHINSISITVPLAKSFSWEPWESTSLINSQVQIINIVKYWSMCEKETSLFRRGDIFSKITITITLTVKCKWNIVCINSWHLSYRFWLGQRLKVNKAFSSRINKNDHTLYNLCYHIKDGNSAT